jgi:7-keto-8-aminopelargonate synthetase-like enzyme
VQIEKIDIITAAMGNALATDGGFCTGSARVVDHQVDACETSAKIEKKCVS